MLGQWQPSSGHDLSAVSATKRLIDHTNSSVHPQPENIPITFQEHAQENSENIPRWSGLEFAACQVQTTMLSKLGQRLYSPPSNRDWSKACAWRTHAYIPWGTPAQPPCCRGARKTPAACWASCDLIARLRSLATPAAAQQHINASTHLKNIYLDHQVHTKESIICSRCDRVGTTRAQHHTNTAVHLRSQHSSTSAAQYVHQLTNTATSPNTAGQGTQNSVAPFNPHNITNRAIFGIF